jgi:hypothetical protein
MEEMNNHKTISYSALHALDRLYKTGGLALVFVFIGLLLTIYGFIFPQGRFSLPTFILGALLILTSFVLFSVVHYKGPIKTRKTLKMNAETLDTLQEISINLVGFTKDIQAYCFKNLDKISGTVNAALPIIKPFLGQKGQDIALKMENITTGIVDISTKTEKIILDIEKALKEGDFKVLKAYDKDIVSLNGVMKNALKS